MKDLQREIEHERNREHYNDIAKKSGLIKDDGKKKLDWMYKSGTGSELDREDYLTGKAIDKNFEQLNAQERASNSNQPKNHVEHDVIPFSIRDYKNLASNEQVDMQRKLVEDPLMAIKQKEIEMRRKILENPVKLKELHRMLKDEKEKKLQEQKPKKSKKSKKKKRSSSTSDSDSSVDDKDLDKLLAEKYKNLKEKGDDSDDETSLDKMLAKKYQALSKELDRMAKKKKKRKSPGSSDDERRYVEKKRDDYRDFDRGRKYRDSRSRSPQRFRKNRSPERSWRSRTPERSRIQRNRSPRPERRRSRTPEYRRDKRRTPETRRDRKRSRSPEPKRCRKERTRTPESLKKSRKERTRSPEPSKRTRKERTKTPDSLKRSRKENSSSESSESSEEETKNYDDDEKPIAKKNFGLVRADGKKIDLQRKESVKLYTKEELKASQAAQKAAWKKPETKKLSDEEIERKRLEMMENAAWREKDRERAVKKYREEDEKEKNEKEFDRHFVNRQLKSAQNQTTSIESRIKSNLNNIQRSRRDMDSHFAKR